MFKDEYERVMSDLKTLGVTTVEAIYNGSDDSGGMEEIKYLAGEHEVDVPDDLRESLFDLCWDIVMQNHSGFENNDGGYGSVILNVLDGTWENAHSDYERITRDSRDSGETEAVLFKNEEAP